MGQILSQSSSSLTRLKYPWATGALSNVADNSEKKLKEKQVEMKGILKSVPGLNNMKSYNNSSKSSV